MKDVFRMGLEWIALKLMSYACQYLCHKYKICCNVLMILTFYIYMSNIPTLDFCAVFVVEDSSLKSDVTGDEMLRLKSSLWWSKSLL